MADCWPSDILLTDWLLPQDQRTLRLRAAGPSLYSSDLYLNYRHRQCRVDWRSVQALAPVLHLCRDREQWRAAGTCLRSSACPIKTPLLPEGQVSSALSPRPMLPCVLAWLLHPGSCPGHPATFLHMHRLNFWPGTSRHACFRKTEGSRRRWGTTRASSAQAFLLLSGAQLCTWGVKPRDSFCKKDISITMLFNRRTVRHSSRSNFRISFSFPDRHKVSRSIFCLV